MTNMALTNQGIEDVLKVVRNSVPQGVGISIALMVAIGGTMAPDAKGDGKHGQLYWPVVGDLKYEYSARGLVLQIPESVAEALRQQGYRAARREIQQVLGIK